MAANGPRASRGGLTRGFGGGAQHRAMPDGLALPLLPEVVRRPARGPAPVDPRLRWRIVAGIGVGHLVLLLLVDGALGPRDVPARVGDADAGVVIRWIDITPPAVPAPAPPTGMAVPSPAAAPVRAPATVPQSAGASGPDAPASAVGSTAAAPAVATDDALDTARLFDPNGRLHLSREVVDAAAATPQPGFAAPPRAELPPIRSPVPYRPTRFDAAWVPDGETLGDELMRKVALEREFKTPWGTRWRCAIVLVFAACGDVPPAPMKNPPKMPWETYIETPEPPRPLD
jgi:hypothetical protein